MHTLSVALVVSLPGMWSSASPGLDHLVGESTGEAADVR
jgi:hypothetical protein